VKLQAFLIPVLDEASRCGGFTAQGTVPDTVEQEAEWAGMEVVRREKHLPLSVIEPRSSNPLLLSCKQQLTNHTQGRVQADCWLLTYTNGGRDKALLESMNTGFVTWGNSSTVNTWCHLTRTRALYTCVSKSCLLLRTNAAMCTPATGDATFMTATQANLRHGSKHYREF
jgi:hypothetical protein